MDKLKEDIEKKRIIADKLRQEVSQMEMAKLEKTHARKTFPTVCTILILN